MPEPNLNKVEIVEPPIEELTKNRSGFKRTCLTGCGCVVLFIVGCVVLLWLIIGPGPKELKAIPPSFPADIPIYDPDSVELITFISGKYKSRGMEVAALFPKIILSPILLKSTPTGFDMEPIDSNPDNGSLVPTIKRLWRLVRTPVGDKRDSLHIEWHNLSAEPNFIISYYRKELRKAGYAVTPTETKGLPELEFSKTNGANGTLRIGRDDSKRAGTDVAILIVNLTLPPP